MDGRDARRSIVLLATRSSPQEGILFPFLSNGRSCAVPWNHNSVIRQGQNAVVQGAHDLLKRSSGEIGASDAAAEQVVAGDQKFFRGKIQPDAALRVAGRLAHGPPPVA